MRCHSRLEGLRVNTVCVELLVDGTLKTLALLSQCDLVIEEIHRNRLHLRCCKSKPAFMADIAIRCLVDKALLEAIRGILNLIRE